MDNNLVPEAETPPAEIVCINCGNPEILPGYPNKLCAECRQKFIKFPIPIWVKLFGAGIVVIMLISFIWLPGNIKAAVLLARAENAANNHNYFTAQRELEKAGKLVPKSIDILSNLVIAAYNNDDIQAEFAAANAIGDRNIEDTSLYKKLNYVLNETQSFFPSDTFKTAMGKYKKGVIPDTAYQHYIKKFPMDLYALHSLASSYCDQEKYPAADSLLSRILTIDQEFLPALNTKTMVKREMHQPDSSILYCNKLLALNHQSLFALSSKARTLLKTGKNKQGLQLAVQCFNLDNRNPYNMATLVIAFHLNNNIKERDAMIAVAEKDSTSASYLKYAKDIISNKVKFQN